MVFYLYFTFCELKKAAQMSSFLTEIYSVYFLMNGFANPPI